jgi:CD63 antigen
LTWKTALAFSTSPSSSSCVLTTSLARLVKGLHVFVNVLFLLAGAGLIAVGAYVIATNGGVLSDELSNTTPLAIMLIVLGGFIFVVSFIGCCGAARESRCLLNTYAIILILLLGSQIAVGVYAFVHKGEVTAKLTQEFWDTKLTLAEQNQIENDFKCCGWTQPDQSGQCAGSNPNPPFPLSHTCAAAVLAWVHSSLFILALVALGVATIQVFGLIFSCCLSAAINASQKAHRHHDRERLLADARQANRMPYSTAPPPHQGANVQYAGYGYQNK